MAKDCLIPSLLGSSGYSDLQRQGHFSPESETVMCLLPDQYNRIPLAVDDGAIPEAQGVVTMATNHPNIVFFCLPFVKPPFPQTTCATVSAFFPFFLFKIHIGTKKEVQKDQDANKPAVSSPKRIAASAAKLHSPGI